MTIATVAIAQIAASGGGAVAPRWNRAASVPRSPAPPVSPAIARRRGSGSATLASAASPAIAA